MKTFTNEKLVKRVLATVDHGLTRGMGSAVPGSMCVEAAVCYALGEPHGDHPSCVHYTVRDFKVQLNDANWSSNQARAKGMRRVAVAQLGSLEIDIVKFAKYLAIQTVKRILPVVLNGLNLIQEAKVCSAVTDIADSKIAAKDARSSMRIQSINAAASAVANAVSATAYSADAVRHVTYADAAVTDTAYSAANAAKAAARAASHMSRDPVTADEILSISAEIAVEALTLCDSEGSKFLYLCDENGG